MTHKSKANYLSSEYKAWDAMIQRCTNPKDRRYKFYGANGVTVCDEWRTSSAAFLGYMGRKPSPQHSLDRIDHSKGYQPGNCRWATRKEQDRNRSDHRMITHAGITLCMTAWAERTGLAPKTIQSRIDQYGWSIEQALSLALRKGRKPLN